MTTQSNAYQNNDKQIYKRPAKDWKEEGYTPTLFITPEGMLGIEVFGTVFVKTIEEWHHMAKQNKLLEGLG